MLSHSAHRRSPLEVTSAYATFAHKGVWCKPMAITKIVDRFGVTIEEYYPERQEVLSEETAFIMTDLLRTVVDRGTGGRVRWMFKFNHPAGGKTGTTQGWTDAWFVGFSPHLAAGVWFGVDDPQVSLGEKQDGSRAALPAWARFMRTVHDTMGWKYQNFDAPAGVSQAEICKVTKDLPTRYCSTEKEYFHFTLLAVADLQGSHGSSNQAGPGKRELVYKWCRPDGFLTDLDGPRDVLGG